MPRLIAYSVWSCLELRLNLVDQSLVQGAQSCAHGAWIDRSESEYGARSYRRTMMLVFAGGKHGRNRATHGGVPFKAQDGLPIYAPAGATILISTHSPEGWQKVYVSYLVGPAGFEPATTRAQAAYHNHARLRPPVLADTIGGFMCLLRRNDCFPIQYGMSLVMREIRRFLETLFNV